MSIIRIIDFETNGLAPPSKVIEVGMADLNTKDRSIKAGPSYYCGADELPAESRAVNHIWSEDIAGLPEFDKNAEFERAKTDNVVAFAAHNAAFEDQWMEGSPVPFICTYKAALRMLDFAPTHSNYGLAYFLMDHGLISIDRADMTPAHRSLPDAVVTAHLLRLLLDEGATIEQLLQWTAEPRKLPTCPIGAWRGSRWADVDIGFLNWILT
jgi:exodeoxyribonuclease X